MKALLAIALMGTLAAVVFSQHCTSHAECTSHHNAHCPHDTEMFCHDGHCECLGGQGHPCETDADCDDVCTGHHVHAHCVRKECHCSRH